MISSCFYEFQIFIVNIFSNSLVKHTGPQSILIHHIEERKLRSYNNINIPYNNIKDSLTRDESIDL